MADQIQAESFSAYFRQIQEIGEVKNGDSGFSNEDNHIDDNALKNGIIQTVDVNLSQLYLDDIQILDYFVGDKAEFVEHARIKSLNVSQNLLIQFPVSFFHFTNLISIDLSNNNLVSISESIHTLPKLKNFYACNNSLVDLPKSMRSLRQLELLNVSGNCFKNIPSVIYELRTLRFLYFGANQIKYLPPIIGKLNNLEILYLGGNRLTDVPATLSGLSKLTSLVLADNQLETLPSTFAELKSLKSLILHNNNLRTLPTSIAQLHNLQNLSLRNNPLITRLVNGFTFETPTLKELAARVVKIRLHPVTYSQILPSDLLNYLDSANQCANPKCRGVYFESSTELMKFVDFCGKHRVPFMQYLCSPRCVVTEASNSIGSISNSYHSKWQ